ncbi:MAG TPA: tetratricopeptide repeat protein, partial [Thermodesulfovibrionales bacterium]|nr:tetratricopeptide repeat protein [Thermodesulfovibrionales bacterium]
KGPFVLDDFTSLDSSKLDSLFSHFRLRVRSIADITFALNYYISGMDPVFFRIANVVFHIVSACLVYRLTRLTLDLPSMMDACGRMKDRSRPSYVPLAAAVVFLLHPIQTSAVNYITQRMAIMAGMFTFAGFIFYIKGATGRGNRSLLHYLFSSLSFVLAIFSKENAVMALPMLAVYDFVFISSFQWSEFRKRFIALVVLLAVVSAAAAYFFRLGGFIGSISMLLSNLRQPMGSFGWTGVDVHWTPIEYLLTELRIVSRYIVLILFPNPSFMVFDYANAYPPSTDLLNPLSTLASFFFLASLLFFSLRYIRRFPLISFGILWYLVTISLESFIALGLDPYFEHRNYLPGFGLFLSFASLFVYAGRLGSASEESASPVGRRKFLNRSNAIISIVVIILFVLTLYRNIAWTREDILWKDVLGKVPLNPRALITLSSISLNEGRFQEAEGYLQKAAALPITRDFKTKMLINQASVYKETNRRPEAKEILKGLLSGESISKGYLNTLYYLMGETLRDEGDYTGARDYLQRAYAMQQNNPRVLISLGLVGRSLGDPGEAEHYFRKAASIAPRSFLPRIELGDIYFMRGDMAAAERLYEDAIAVEPDIPKDMVKGLFLTLGQIKLAKGEIDKATELFKKVIGIDPSSCPPYIFLGDIYMKRGELDTAISHFRTALSLKKGLQKEDPNAKLVYYNLGIAYLAKGQRQPARENLAIFLSLAGGDRRLSEQIRKAEEKLAGLRP